MRLAIVKLSALGDIVHAMVVLQYIKKYDKNITIDWFVEERFSGILENNPQISNIYKLKLKNNKLNFLSEYKKLKQLSQQNCYDFVIDLQGLIKSAIVSRILCKDVIGFDKIGLREPAASLFYTKKFNIPYEENVIERNIKLVSCALAFSMPDLEKKVPFLFSNIKSVFYPRLLIITGSSWESKVYPKEHFISIIKALNVETFVSWGNEKEKKDAEFICQNSEAKMLPKLSLDELKSVISNSNLVIGADSGPTHMAWALNRPSITIFGPTPSERNMLQTDKNKSINCNKDIDAKALNKNDFCIREIDPKKIVEIAKDLLEC
ncbi:MAG: lipopolysaccharide heptosyltransferase I [Sulfurospirillaceae bacterium]|nr:lipopolysaccharide heptosyltransferase I [Sulfurospirillaceae bacterium]